MLLLSENGNTNRWAAEHCLSATDFLTPSIQYHTCKEDRHGEEFIEIQMPDDETVRQMGKVMTRSTTRVQSIPLRFRGTQPNRWTLHLSLFALTRITERAWNKELHPSAANRTGLRPVYTSARIITLFFFPSFFHVSFLLFSVCSLGGVQMER